jgi:predicted NUDIX family NTP pyrophosphohydrolase
MISMSNIAVADRREDQRTVSLSEAGKRKHLKNVDRTANFAAKETRCAMIVLQKARPMIVIQTKPPGRDIHFLHGQRS